MTVIWLALGAMLLNIPFGYGRSRSEKFGAAWIFFVHAPVPLVVLARLGLGIGWAVVPLLIAASVAGQIAGGRLFSPRGAGLGSRPD